MIILEDMQQGTLINFTTIHLGHPLLVMQTELMHLMTLSLQTDFK